MHISATDPYQIIYSLYEHEYLGYLIESFVVKVDEKGGLTLQHQNISSKNASEFSDRLDEVDFKLIKLMDSIQQEAVVKKYSKVYMKPQAFFLKIYDEVKGNKLVQEEIGRFLENKRSLILELLHGKRVFEMGSDGEPTWKELEVLKDKASILFHFRKNDDNTHYFPTIKHLEKKIEFQYKQAYLVCKSPAWLVLEGKVYSFEKDVDGPKVQPFLNKKFIVIPKKVEHSYYTKFIAPLISNFNVYAKGFDITTDVYKPIPVLYFSQLQQQQQPALTLFNGNGSAPNNQKATKIIFDLKFKYGSFILKTDHMPTIQVKLEKVDDHYTFHRLKRNLEEEKGLIKQLQKSGLKLSGLKTTMPVSEAFEWLQNNRSELEQQGVQIIQNEINGKKYFIGESSISVEINENIDWFDINAIIKFGEFEIAFKELRNLVNKGQHEIKLPNGETAVIPASWIEEYAELFSFLEVGDGNQHKLQKHHVALVQDLDNGELTRVTMNRKLEQLRDFDSIEDMPLPIGFKGTLRPYQKAGYNWMHFLNNFKFGGCLADDMGLGKTVQTLAMLQAQKEKGAENATLLVMPTSLIYNWVMEAKKFTPKLKVFNYTGTNRVKDISLFKGYDLVLSSYGIIRRDVELLQQYYFNYIILDESQAIKNPTSNISKAVRKLNAKHRLILTGTPLENSTMDLWSQISFINPGLLGGQSFFRTSFQIPIEKQNSEVKTSKLFSIIKPFVMRRLKSQVAKDLPEKVENVQYCTMTTMQQELYDEVKNKCRNQILNHINEHGMGRSHMMLLQGLTQLRQIANHPKMVDPEYQGDSGKMDDMMHMLASALSEDHKLLVFSQFVKHLTIVREILDSRGIAYCYLDGSTKNRQAEVERFQNDESVKVFLISLKAGGLGLNLTRADYVFLLDPWWNPAVEAQAVDRAHRIGQKRTVFTYKFISRNTVEEKILALQKRKMKLAQDLITTEQSFVKSLSKDDIANLLD